ncbi:MAG: hypothetical protein R2776_07360 [Flavobacteriaceae bacterium]|nr:hypothetical protein [Flavobacteriaceae bacterium]
MARNTSFIKLEGTLDGLTFYEKDGENFVKTKSAISKNRIANDAAFVRTRENNQEFSGCSKASKAVREAFATVVKLMGDTYITGRLTGIMKRINKNGVGVRGERAIDIVANKELLTGFEFNPKDTLSSQFYAPYAPPAFTLDRDGVTVLVPDFNASSFLNAPEGATHFKLVLASGLVSNYAYETALESYEPIDEDENGKGLVAFSAAYSVKGMVGAAITLTTDFSLGSALPATVSNMVALGIVFYQEINSELYELASGNGMQIITVG